MPLLNEKEIKVAKLFTKRIWAGEPAPLHLKEIALAAFPDNAQMLAMGGSQAYRWAQNSTRRMVREGVLQLAGRGQYEVAQPIVELLTGPDLGQRVKSWREDQGLSHEDAAEELGLKWTYIANMEGQNKLAISDLFALTHAFGLRISDVVPNGVAK